MSKLKNSNKDNIKQQELLDNEILDNEIDDISIEELDKEIEGFYIDNDEIDSIKAPSEMKLWVRESIERAQSDIKKEKQRKKIIGTAASFLAILSVGVYSPALAHFAPPIEKLLTQINQTLRVDEITSFIGLDKLIPKIELNEKEELIIKKVPKYKVEKPEERLEGYEYIEEEELDIDASQMDIDEIETMPSTEYDAIQFIHQMSNSIIIATDNRKYGEVEITPKNINIAIAVLKQIRSNDARDYLYSNLLRWKDGDFSNAVSVHNYVWELLDGEVGKAALVDYKKVEKVLNKNFN
ncbi:MAG: DUF6241 domain-containing protein [Peptostreptococcaceae bacterium]